jgi:uncharacterized membrane protein
MLHVIFILLGVVLLGVGTYTDFRWREVPDWVNYGVLFSAGLLRITFAVVEQNIDFIISGLLCLCFTWASGVVVMRRL